MYFTRQSQTALSILAVCARNPDIAFTARQLAGNIGATEDYTGKTVTILLRHGLLTNDCGMEGSVRLAVVPDEVTLGSVLRLTQPELDAALRSGDRAGLSHSPAFGMLVSAASFHFIQMTERFTLADLAAGGRTGVFVPAVMQNANFCPGPST